MHRGSTLWHVCCSALHLLGSHLQSERRRQVLENSHTTVVRERTWISGSGKNSHMPCSLQVSGSSQVPVLSSWPDSGGQALLCTFESPCSSLLPSAIPSEESTTGGWGGVPFKKYLQVDFKTQVLSAHLVPCPGWV